MNGFNEKETCHTLGDELKYAKLSGNHYLQSSFYIHSPLFDIFNNFQDNDNSGDTLTSNALPSEFSLNFEEELKVWDDLSDEAWLE